MGKTKTAFVSDVGTEGVKSSEDAYREKIAKRKAAEAAKPKKSLQPGGLLARRVKVAGLKGGQKIKIIGADVADEKPEVAETPDAKSETPQEKKARKQKVRGKKYQTAKSAVKPGQTYKLTEAVKLVKETSYSKFIGAVELHLVVKKAGLSVNVTLPHSAGKAKRIEIASAKTIEKLKSGKIDFDILLATPEMMPQLIVFARTLGPKGLMPNPKNGTIIKSEKDLPAGRQVPARFLGNTLSLRTEKDAPLIHTVIGKTDQPDKELAANCEVIITAFGGTKQIVRAFLKATMGPSVRIAL